MAFVKSRGFALPEAVYSTSPLRDAQNLGWWWPSDQRCEPSQVLSDGSENKLILGAAWAMRSKSTEPQDALQVCEPHLDLLALTSRLLKARRRLADDDYGVLPLTKEFLSSKWHEHQTFRKKVIARLDEMFESEGAEGVLLEWSEERRVQHLTLLARKRTEMGDYQRALKMINLAQSWLNSQDLHQQEIILRFLEGQNLYELGRKAGGIAHMRQAVTAEAADSSLQAADFLFFAEALFAFGGHSTEKEACQNVSMGIQRGAKPSMPAWTTFVECSIKRSDFKPLASMVSSLDDMDMLALVFDRLGKLLVGTAGHTHVDEWASALNRMLTSPHLEAEKKSYYRDLVTENRALSARLKLNS